MTRTLTASSSSVFVEVPYSTQKRIEDSHRSGNFEFDVTLDIGSLYLGHLLRVRSSRFASVAEALDWRDKQSKGKRLWVESYLNEMLDLFHEDIEDRLGNLGYGYIDIDDQRVGYPRLLEYKRVSPEKIRVTFELLGRVEIPEVEEWSSPFRYASDRRSLIRLASTMEKGSEERRAILAGLKVALRNRRQGFSHKTAARNDKRLAAALLKYLREIQDESQERRGGDPAFGRGGKYDPVSDVGVWVGKDEVKRYSDSGADVILHYDGGGHDVFSDHGDYAYMGLRDYRDHVEKLGEKYGYDVEPLNNWSLGYYYKGL